jgi:Na+-translocating ferredoxin:NAD+ oxidoreductase subunit G
MNQMMRFGIVLGVICLSATLVLALTYQVTKPKIDEELKREEQEALRIIFPDAEVFNKKVIDGIDYFEALKKGKAAGYCLRIIAAGYNGFIRLLVGIDLNGVIRGVRVLEHQETPGLGAKINEVKPGEQGPWFLRQFTGKSAKDIEIKKNIDAITGATISSRAVTDAIKKGVDEFLEKVKNMERR